MIIAGTVVGVYLLLMAGVALNQRHMIYFPSQYPLAELAALGSEHGFKAWTNTNGEIIGWKRASTKQAVIGQIMILHGNAGQALNWADMADALQAVAPLDVYILEYPGYGGRSGKPSEKTIFSAASEGLSLLSTNRTTFLLGESLGTGVAAYLAGTAKERVAGVLLIGAYNNMSAVGQHHMRIFPVRLLLREKYASDRYLKTFNGPVGILVGGHDRTIPSRYGRRLYDSYRGPKRLWEEPMAGHDDLHHRSPEWWKEAVEFLQQK